MDVCVNRQTQEGVFYSLEAVRSQAMSRNIAIYEAPHTLIEIKVIQ